MLAFQAGYEGSIPFARSIRPGWRNGRRSRLKICRPRGCEGSTPSPGTIIKAPFYWGFFVFIPHLRLFPVYRVQSVSPLFNPAFGYKVATQEADFWLQKWLHSPTVANHQSLQHPTRVIKEALASRFDNDADLKTTRVFRVILATG